MILNRDFYSILHKHIDHSLAMSWKNSSVSRLEISHQSKMWRLFIDIEQPLPTAVIDRTREELLEKWDFLRSLDIVPIYSAPLHQLEGVIVKCQEELSAHQSYPPNHIKWRIRSTGIDVVTDEGSTYQCMLENQLCDRISKWFWTHYRLQILVRALWEEKHINTQEGIIDGGIIRKPLELLDKEDDQRAGHKPRKKAERKWSRKQIENKSVTRIIDIEEGMQSAVVEGEIWDKEFTLLRDGRFIINYYLTDYSDSIIVKIFVKSKQEDELNIGDRVKVIGSVRFDNFAKELTLFMDSYLILPNLGRVDESESKRIEFHAHTKMSAMDGLTDVKKLIKRAAEWKHSAIAITDHGGVQAFPDAYHASREYGIKVIYGLEGYLVETDKREKPYHVIMLAQNVVGLKNLYRLVSFSYLDHFYRHPKIPRQLLQEHREGILIGSACQAGELFQGILNGKEDDEIINIASFYDYLEIQPTANNEFLVREDKLQSIEQLQDINRCIVNLGRQLNKPVIATGDVHYLDPEDEIFRTIIQAGQGYEDLESESALYFKNTDEMLEEFSYLGPDDARAVVVDFPEQLNNMIDQVKPVPDGFYPPQIDTAADEVTALTWKRAHELYGEILPDIVEERIKHELHSITEHGFSVLYLIAHKLVLKSNQDGYLVGSRGSVGSSLVAYLTGITEVNPLQPHLLCRSCHRSIFDVDKTAECGVDLGAVTCTCGEAMLKEGFNIPFETFLGFEGDKVPDIDLNFSGDYQMHAHHYVEELFGSENVFRAGTISTIAEKTAFGFVKKYIDQYELNTKNSEIKRLVKGITGVRRTTGQHPGGLIVVPKGKDIHEFTPLQHPADNKDSGVVTTHFEYHAIGDQLVKLDILGHDDPTVIRELEQLTGVKAADIKLDDPDTMRIFSEVEVLGIKAEDIDSPVGTFGIPEFGTRFVRQMLEATRPNTFAELVRISGLSHGTDVWLNNAQDLIENGTSDLNQVICTRDDIMTYLITRGVDKKQSFNIMERVRKGKGLAEKDIPIMEECQVPEWYIKSCQKIKYMFPRAHAVAYVTMAFRIAYFKVNYPLQFYASFFSIRAEDFDARTILDGYQAVRKKIKEIDKMGNSATQKDKKLITILELAMEMYARGHKFYPVDIYSSDAVKFKVYEDGLLLPFCALPNVGNSAALGVTEARLDKPFVSVEEFQARTHLNKTAMAILREYDCFKDLPETTQISLFG
ncbi:dna polymerase iii alpha subunit [hydrocarbon metagenome]|uniref:DNA-directed DNA polymerase n=1 Tax=hydrocarbon metagenome TaxID=938273 RepID=A0A0W8E3Q4_9ZZZZ